MDELSPANRSEMVISKFDGQIDAYWWVLCTEKYFKHWHTPETYKMIVAGLAMKGPALTWWLRWYPRHSCVNWDTFTSIFLWQFKSEWREILPVTEEDLELEPPELMQGGYGNKQPKVVEERINDFNPHSSPIDAADLEIAASVKDSTVQSQFVSKTSFKNEYKPLFFQPENQEGDNKIQPYEFVIEGLDTVTTVADEQKGLITSVCKDKDMRLYFDFNFLVSDQFRSSCFTLARFTPTFAVPSMKVTVITTSATSPQHLVPLFDPGGYFIEQESCSTNQVLPPPPKPPDRSFYCVSAFIYNKEMLDYSAIWTMFSGFASIDYVQVLSQIPYLLQFDLHFNFYAFNIASSIYLHKLCLEYHVDGLACYRNDWESGGDSQCVIYLMNFYANVGVYSAQKVFAEMLEQSVVTWFTFIKGDFTGITYGWEVYTSLSLGLSTTYTFDDAFKCCILSNSSQAWSLIICSDECICNMPLQYEDYQVGLLKKLGLKVPTIASTYDLVWVHEHYLLVFSPKHTQSKLIKNGDLMQSLFFTKEAIVLVAFLVYGERLLGYYSIGCFDKAMSIMLTLTCLDALCSNCLRLWTYNNGIVPYYQVPIIGLEEYKPNLISFVGDYIDSFSVQPIKLRSFVHNYPNSNLLANVWLAIFISSLESQCDDVVLVPWKGLTPTFFSHCDKKYWKTFYNLEDKVGIHGGDSSDIIHVVWEPCMLAWMCHNKGTICDTKTVKIMEKINHKIVRLQYCCIMLDGNLVAIVFAFGVTKIVTSLNNGCESMHVMVRPCASTSQLKMERMKMWDPGRHDDMHTTTWSSKFKQWDPCQHLGMSITKRSLKFKQWDPGKIYARSNFYNLEDKVDFEGVGNVMILEA